MNSPSSQKPIQAPTNSSGFGGLASFAGAVAATSTNGNELPRRAKTVSARELSLICTLTCTDMMIAEPSKDLTKFVALGMILRGWLVRDRLSGEEILDETAGVQIEELLNPCVA